MTTVGQGERDGRAQGTHPSAALCAALASMVAVALTALLVLNDVGRGPDDDLGIAMVLSGIYPASGQCPFTNALLNHIMFALGQLVPALNAALVVERLSALVALVALCYGLLRHIRWGVAWGVIGFTAFLVYPLCTMAANFTVVGALCVFSGEVLLLLFAGLKRPSLAVAGMALALLGFMWRSSVFLLSLPFLVIGMALVVLHRRQGCFVLDRSALRSVCLALAILFAAAGALGLYHQVVWSEPMLAHWEEYSDARSRLCDYPVRPYGEIADDLEALGVSENDYWCMTHWITADPDFFTAERLAAVAEVAQADGVGGPAAALRDEAKSLLLEQAPLFAGLVALGVVFFLTAGARPLIALISVVTLSFMTCVYFRYTGRLPVRVEYPTYLYGLLLPLAWIVGHPAAKGVLLPEGSLCRGRAAFACGVSIMLLACGGLGWQYGSTVNVSRVDQFVKQSAFADSRSLVRAFEGDESIQVWDPKSFALVERQLLYRYLPPRSFMDHNVMAGGWTQGSPLVAAKNAELAIENPLRALGLRSDARFVSANDQTVEHVLTYVREHYDPAVKSVVERSVEAGKRTLQVVRFMPVAAEEQLQGEGP